ncbi:tetratricopeptide repeat-containing sulfotransferase family protein [Prochlorococcus marinus]|uniref:tetratricopeptide repeat-containing sulfotransferase family protein n=1 Tax=Prochlorococcus marinus TaxID=1219 RepID=UPI0022B2C353|nr:tetratricopeptide repeat-containing sulfotransferase family protein [Prochlorococcus marinus]
MCSLHKRKKVKHNTAQVSIFTVPHELREVKENLFITTDNFSIYYQNEIINKAFRYHSQGNISEAAKYYQDFLDQGFKDHRVFSNYGVILKDLGKLEEAEAFMRKALLIKPESSDYNYNLGGILKDQNKFREAEFYTTIAIKFNPVFADAYSNLGGIQSDLYKFSQAESSLRKSIELNSNVSEYYYNLGEVLVHLGKFYEAKEYLIKAIKLKPNFIKAYYVLSRFGSIGNKEIEENIFSDEILYSTKQEELVDIYFARSNILHRRNKFRESAKYLKLANNIKFKIRPYEFDKLSKYSYKLLNKNEIQKLESNNLLANIFIVGMTRSGSTLLESILSINKEVLDLGEINIFEDSYLEWMNLQKDNINCSLEDIYNKNILEINNSRFITTNKCLHNYIYTGIIVNYLSSSRVIHCYRNPLDNILSIYRSNFARGNDYSSSLVDCAKLYLLHDHVMGEYKKKYRSKIYDLNYDLLVKDPIGEIKSLIKWLDWEWKDCYLSPQLNKRSVLTASNIQVRSPINSKSIGGWKNYREMLQPAIDILVKHEKYKNLQFL